LSELLSADSCRTHMFIHICSPADLSQASAASFDLSETRSEVWDSRAQGNSAGMVGALVGVANFCDRALRANEDEGWLRPA